MKKNVLTLFFIIAFNVLASAQTSWIQKMSMNDNGRYAAIGFAINGKGYVGLGQVPDGSKVYDLWEYDPTLNSWTKKADYPGVGSYAATAFVINGKGYVGLGEKNSTTNANDLWEYTPGTNTWKRMADFPGTARYGASSFVIGDTAFVGTGSYGNPNDYLEDMWMYVLSTNSWSRIADFPGLNRLHAIGFAIGAFGYLGTGLSNKTSVNSDFWRYDKTNNTWTRIPNFSGTARMGCISFVVNNKAYVGFGFDINRDYNDFYEYDPIKNTWSTQIITSNNAPTRRQGIAFSIDKIGYMGTGYLVTGLFSDLWSFDLNAVSKIITYTSLIRCSDGPSITLTAKDGFIHYLWSPGGETTPSIKVTDSGLYKVTVIPSAGNVQSDSVEVIVSKPIVDLGKDRTICNPGTLVLDAGNQFTSYLWSTPTTQLTTQTIAASTSGIYSVTATNGFQCTASDTIKLSFVDKPKLDLNKLDKLMCGKFSTVLDVSADKNVSWLLECADPKVNINDLTISVAQSDQGTYPVILTAKDSFSCATTAAFNLGFFKSPVVNLGNDSTICNPQSITLNAGNQLFSYLWAPTGETTSSIIVKNNGIYRVGITDLNGCKTSDSVKIAFTDKPKLLNLSSVDTLICGKFTTTLNLASDKIVTYSLESINPKVNITGLTASVSPADYGTYPVTVTAKDQFSCSTSAMFNLGFYNTPKVGFNVDDKTCSGYNLNVSYVGDANKNISNFNWMFGGDEIANQIGLNSLIVPLGINRSGRDLSLTVTQNGCSNSYTLKDIKVIPNLSLPFADTLGCAPFNTRFTAVNTEVVTYDWDFGDGTPLQRTDSHPSHLYQNPGYYGVKLKVTTVVPNGVGCYNEVKIDSFVHIAPVPTATFTPLDDCLAAGNHDISYFGSGNVLDRYIWDLKEFDSGDIIRNPNETSGPLTFNLLSKPQVNIGLKVISKYGCTSNPITALVKRKPVFSVNTSSGAGCIPLEVEFNGKVNDPVDKVNYTWDFGDGSNGTGDLVKHEYGDPNHQYDIVLTASSSITGCSDTLSKKGFVTTYPKPLAAFDVDHKIVYNDKPTINFFNASVGATSYSWDFGDGATSTIADPSHYFTAAGYRTVLLESFNDFKCYDTISHQILVAFNRIFPPNAFSPNAPNPVDRIFQLSSIGLKEEGYHLTILSRWNDIVFETRNEIKGWDGRMKNGNYAPAGNYVWILDFTDFLDRPHRQSGTVTLIF